MKTFNLLLCLTMLLLLSTSVIALRSSVRKGHYIKESEMFSLHPNLQIAFLGDINSSDERLLCFNDKRQFNIENVGIVNMNTIKTDQAIELAFQNEEKRGELDAIGAASPTIARNPIRGSSYMIPLIYIRRIYGFDLCDTRYEDPNKVYILTVGYNNEYIGYIFTFPNHSPMRRLLYQSVHTLIYDVSLHSSSLPNYMSYINNLSPIMNKIFDGYLLREYAKEMLNKENNGKNILETFAYTKKVDEVSDNTINGLAVIRVGLETLEFRIKKLWNTEMDIMEYKWKKEDLMLVLKEKMLNNANDDPHYYLTVMAENFKYKAMNHMEELANSCVHNVLKVVIRLIRQDKMDLASDILKLYAHLDYYKTQKSNIMREYHDNLP